MISEGAREKEFIDYRIWRAKGEFLFGNDMMTWRFICPVCGNIQSPEDFRKFKSAGATPESALKECIGRYLNRKRKAIGYNDEHAPEAPCDYAAYGLFRLSPLVVTFEDGSHCDCFDFAVEQSK